MAWQPTEEIYINLSCRSSLSTVVCGDNEGSVWIYDIKSQIVNAKKPGAPTNKKFRVKPLKVSSALDRFLKSNLNFYKHLNRTSYLWYVHHV